MKIVFESRVKAPVAEVFEFHRDPSNLETLMAGWPGFRLLHHDSQIRPGSEIWFEQTAFYVFPIVFGFQHTECQPPYRFAERMIHGPCVRFDHCHEFEASGNGCLIREILDVRLPRHYGGESMIRWYVAPALRRVFAERRLAFDRLFHLAA